MRMKKLSLAVAVAALSWSGLASAAPNTHATLTADNEFKLYYGDAAGSYLHYVGAGTSWPTAYTLDFSVNPGDYLYVMAYDWGQPHAWQGVFNTPSGTVYSNAASWVAINNPSFGNPTAPANPNDKILSGSTTWGSVTTELPYDSSPWGARVNNANAKWIWSSDLNSADQAVLFRTAVSVSPVPEPESYALMFAGLGLLGFMARRKMPA